MLSVMIDGVEIPAPSGYDFDEEDLIANESYNAKGVRSWDVVRANVGQLRLTWASLSREGIMQISAAVRGKKTISVTFLNLHTGVVETRAFQPGKRASSAISMISSVEWLSSLTIPFVEV